MYLAAMIRIGSLWPKQLSQASSGMRTFAFLEKHFSTSFQRLNMKYFVKTRDFERLLAEH